MATFTTASRTWATSEVVTAANMNAQLRDLINGFGAHTTYTPTFTGWTGAGTATGRYTQIGKLVWFEAQWAFSATPTVAGTPTLTLPVTAAAAASSVSLVRGMFTDSGVNNYNAIANIVSTTTVSLYIPGASGLFTVPTLTTPFTWGNLDTIYVSGLYAAA